MTFNGLLYAALIQIQIFCSSHSALISSAKWYRYTALEDSELLFRGVGECRGGERI